jgi:hypothetical protein
MNPEDRLRQAIDARTQSVEPSSDGLDKIEEKLMEAQRSDRNQKRLLIGLSAVATIVAVVLGAVVLAGDEDKKVDVADGTTSSTTPTTVATTTTTGGPTTTTLVPVDPSMPLFPVPTNGLRYDDPVEVAKDFAIELVGFQAPIVGEFQQGDSRSGEVPIKAKSNGTVTNVLVRQLEDDHWWVIGATTDDIVLTSPERGDTVTSPVRLKGESIAFEAVVNVTIYADAAKKLVVGEGFVMGGGTEMAPFDGTVEYDLQGSGAEWGVIILVERSAEDGFPRNATAVRVHFG